MGGPDRGQAMGKGAITGASMGTAIAPGWGTAVGAVAGTALGAIDPGLFASGTPDAPDMTFAYDRYKQRLGQIDEFQNALNSESTSYINAYNNFQSLMFSNYMTNAIPYFASHGMQVNGGAFSAEAARQGSLYQDKGIANAYNTRRADLQAVDSARGGAFQGIFGASVHAGELGSAWNNQNNQAGQEGMAGLFNNFIRPGADGGPSMASQTWTGFKSMFPASGGSNPGFGGSNPQFNQSAPVGYASGPNQNMSYDPMFTSSSTTSLFSGGRSE